MKTLRNRLSAWLQSMRPGKQKSTRVDAGRTAFASITSKETRQKKNLLRKINDYRAQRKLIGHKSPENAAGAARLKRILLLGGCLALVSTLFWLTGGRENITSAMQSIDMFRITMVDVRGNVRSAQSRIRASSQVMPSSSMFAVDAETVTAAIKENNPWVRHVSVIRQWPDTVILEIKEYTPHALLTVQREAETTLYYLDSHGVPFVRADVGRDFDYPVITGLEHVSDAEERLEKLRAPLLFLRYVGANNPNLPIQSVSEVHVDPEEGLVVYLVEHPFPIFLGNGGIRQKYLRLRKVLEVLYKPRKMGMDIARVAYIRMDYLEDKVIVGYSESNESNHGRS